MAGVQAVSAERVRIEIESLHQIVLISFRYEKSAVNVGDVVGFYRVSSEKSLC